MSQKAINSIKETFVKMNVGYGWRAEKFVENEAIISLRSGNVKQPCIKLIVKRSQNLDASTKELICK